MIILCEARPSADGAWLILPNISHNKYNVAHMDIKPDNLVYDVEHERLLIIDFGSAILLQDENEELKAFATLRDGRV